MRYIGNFVDCLFSNFSTIFFLLNVFFNIHKSVN